MSKIECTMLTRAQLEWVIMFHHYEQPLPIGFIQQLYDKYGDKYVGYLEDKDLEWVLCEENPYWKIKRGLPGYPKLGDKFEC